MFNKTLGQGGGEPPTVYYEWRIQLDDKHVTFQYYTRLVRCSMFNIEPPFHGVSVQFSVHILRLRWVMETYYRCWCWRDELDDTSFQTQLPVIMNLHEWAAWQAVALTTVPGPHVFLGIERSWTIYQPGYNTRECVTSYEGFPAATVNTKRRPSAGLLVDHRLQRWANITSVVGQPFVWGAELYSNPRHVHCTFCTLLSQNANLL